MTAGTEQDITYLQLFLTNIPLYHPQTASRHKGKDEITTGTLSLLKKKSCINIRFTSELSGLHSPTTHLVTIATGKDPFVLEIIFSCAAMNICLLLYICSYNRVTCQIHHELFH